MDTIIIENIYDYKKHIKTNSEYNQNSVQSSGQYSLVYDENYLKNNQSKK
jgi:hypothetical protein